jgi:hypothetical protein
MPLGFGYCRPTQKNSLSESKMTDVFEEYFATVNGTIIDGHKAPDDLQMQRWDATCL